MTKKEKIIKSFTQDGEMVIMSYGDETPEDVERRLRLILDSDELEFYVNFHLKRLSLDFLREVKDKIEIVNLLTEKFNDFNLYLQEEEKVGWEDFIRFYYKKCREFI